MRIQISILLKAIWTHPVETLWINCTSMDQYNVYGVRPYVLWVAWLELPPVSISIASRFGLWYPWAGGASLRSMLLYHCNWDLHANFLNIFTSFRYHSTVAFVLKVPVFVPENLYDSRVSYHTLSQGS